MDPLTRSVAEKSESSTASEDMFQYLFPYTEAKDSESSATFDGTHQVA
jgi:hypothetical protein